MDIFIFLRTFLCIMDNKCLTYSWVTHSNHLDYIIFFLYYLTFGTIEIWELIILWRQKSEKTITHPILASLQKSHKDNAKFYSICYLNQSNWNRRYHSNKDGFCVTLKMKMHRLMFIMKCQSYSYQQNKNKNAILDKITFISLFFYHFRWVSTHTNTPLDNN